MSITEVIERGFCTRRETGDSAKLSWLSQESARRFLDLQWVREARRLNIRTAHRRWLRRNGYNFHGKKRAA